MYNYGVVLKKSIDNKVILFDKVEGKCVTRIKTHRPSHILVGSLVEYAVDAKKIKEINYINMLVTPLGLAKHDILFFQQFLDICVTFISYGLPSREIFNLAIIVLFHIDGSLSKNLKMRLLLKLFWHIGIYPEDITSYKKMMNYLHADLLEDILKEDYFIADDFLMQWLNVCYMQKWKK